jgi:tRNA pseudouridine38-40 synthase
MALRWRGSSSSSARPDLAHPVPSSCTVRLDLAYDGTGFRGWARQRDPSIRTVEGTLVTALEPLVGAVRLSVAGRTDAGVHARGQVASFLHDRGLDPERLARAVNARLAPEVVIVRAALAPFGFDARRSASGREYAYVLDTGAIADPFTARYRWHRPGALSVPRMRRAASALVGVHDFASFCRRDGDRSTVRHLRRLAVTRSGDTVRFVLRANAFCQQMVRSLVGTLVAVGSGALEPEGLEGILEVRDRSAAARIAPPHGLTLERVLYGRRERLHL